MKQDTVRLEAKIRRWIRGILADGGIERFDDLHIGDISKEWSKKSAWVEGMVKSLHIARTVCATGAPDKVVALMCSLKEETLETPRNLVQLEAQMDWTPPSLYLFHAGKEPWKNLSSNATVLNLPLEGFSSLEASQVLLYQWSSDEALGRTFIAI